MGEPQHTEAIALDSRGFDTWDDGRILATLLASQRCGLDAVQTALPAIARAAALMAETVRAGGRLIYAGAGTSIRVAVQEGSELPATFGIADARIAYLIAGGRAAIFETLADAEDDVEAGRRDASIGAPGDLLIAVAASGRTPYTCAAAEAAKSRGAAIVAVVNNSGTDLGRLADIEIGLASGPEVISGSTRLAAGTAQKIALNLMSCLAFTRLGAVHDGLMVDVEAGNHKLQARSRNIVMALTGVDAASAAEALIAVGHRIKPAVLLLRGASSAAAADALLAETQGNLRQALARLQTSC